VAVDALQQAGPREAVPGGSAPAGGRCRRWAGTCRAFVTLTKPRIVEFLLITTVPTMCLAYHGIPPLGLVAATVTGGALTAGGANALNMVYDRDIDARMSRTSRRPLVTGVVSPLVAVLFAAGLEVAGFTLLWAQVSLVAAGLALGAAAFYVGIYTALLKRRTSQNIVIGGAAGAAPVLVGWAAVTGGVAPVAWGLFAIVCLWTPPHTWALGLRYRDDYAGVGVPMLPAVAPPATVANWILAYTAGLVAVSLAIAPIGGLGVVYLGGAAPLGAVFMALAWRVCRDPAPRRAMALFHYSIVYVGLLFACVGAGALVR
jgi:protoheme IX farnesyltransferase